MGFPRQEYWSGLPLPPPGDLPDPRNEPVSPALAGGFFTSEPPGKPTVAVTCISRLGAWGGGVHKNTSKYYKFLCPSFFTKNGRVPYCTFNLMSLSMGDGWER